MRLLIVIPAYNEEASIVATMTELERVAKEFDYVIINDGSKDATLDICKQYGYNYISLPINCGLTCAFKTGMNYAQIKGYDAVLQFDADGQHDPSYIAPLLKKLSEDKVDILIGSRFVDVDKPKSARMIGSRLICGIIALTTKKKLTDPTSGMRMYNKKMIDIFAHKSDFGPEPDSLAYLIRKGAKIEEMQVSMRERMAGESYLNPIRALHYMLRTCTSIIFAQWFRS